MWIQHPEPTGSGEQRPPQICNIRRDIPRYARLLDGWRERRDACGTLGEAVDRFLKVTDRYRPGLFHYLEVPGLPATNNDLEPFFGAQRHHERRTTGRKEIGAPPPQSRQVWSCAAPSASSPPR